MESCPLVQSGKIKYRLSIDEGEPRTWIGSEQGAVATWSNHGSQKLNTDQVATAPCTDPIQE